MAQPKPYIRGDGVYLLHFDTPYKHAQHYRGYSDNVQHRVIEHQLGHAGPLTRAVRKAGIIITLARVWPHRSRHFEARLRAYKNNRHLCPICTPNAYARPITKRVPKGYVDPF